MRALNFFYACYLLVDRRNSVTLTSGNLSYPFRPQYQCFIILSDVNQKTSDVLNLCSADRCAECANRTPVPLTDVKTPAADASLQQILFL